MHISLDSALGRDQRLNSLGETITSIAAPTAAYSLRSLTGGDPRSVRVRRSSDDNEQDFTVSGINSGALVDFVGSGNNGFVETWYDQLGNGFDATQTTAANQPKIVNSGSLITGGLLFDGSNDLLSANDLSSVVTGEDKPLSVFTVAIRESSTGVKALWAFERSTTTTPSIQITSHPIFDKYGYKITDDSGTNKQETDVAYTDDTQFLMTFASSGTLLDFGKNGTLSQDDEDVDVGTITLDRFTIGGGVNTDVTDHKGTINEMIVFTSDQRSNRTAIEANINSHYSIF